MARVLLTVALKAYDAGLTDMTDMTGGNSETVGVIGTDWTFLHAVTEFNSMADEGSETDGIRKAAGNRQIVPELYSAGADPLPTLSNDSGNAHLFTADAGDRFHAATALAAGSQDDGVQVTVSSSRLDSGVSYTFPISTALQTFWWLGWQRNGGYRAQISVSDASFATQSVDLPFGALNVKTDAWFEATFQGGADQVDAGVTVTVKLDRYYVESGRTSAIVGLRAQLLREPVPAPKCSGARNWLAYANLYGGANV
jgi:hypothetical protein